MSLNKEIHMDCQVFNITERGTPTSSSTTSDIQNVTFTRFCVLLYVFQKDTHSTLSPHIKQWRFLQFVFVFGLERTIPGVATWASALGKSIR